MQQLIVQPDELDAIVARLSTQPKKDNKKQQLEQTQTVKLVFAQDTAKGKGYKETFQPVKRVSSKVLFKIHCDWVVYWPIAAWIIHDLNKNTRSAMSSYDCITNISSKHILKWLRFPPAEENLWCQFAMQFVLLQELGAQDQTPGALQRAIWPFEMNKVSCSHFQVVNNQYSDSQQYSLFWDLFDVTDAGEQGRGQAELVRFGRQVSGIVQSNKGGLKSQDILHAVNANWH